MIENFIANLLRATLLLLATFAGANDAAAYEVTDSSLEDKVRLADAVIVGEAASDAHAADIGYGLSKFVTIRVQAVLKGKVSDQIEVLVRGNIPELDPDCCRRGAHYVFFVNQIKGMHFVSVNGSYGIYEIRSDNKSNH